MYALTGSLLHACSESQTVNDRYELNDLDEHSQRYYTATCEVVCLTEAEKDRYRALFSSALISYNSLKIGDTIGEGIMN